MDLQLRKNALECARQSGVSCPSTLSLYKFYTLATAKEQEKIQTLELEVEKWKLATQKNADCIRSLTKQCAELVQEKHDLLYKRAN